MPALGGWLVGLSWNLAPYIYYGAYKYMAQDVFNAVMPRILARLPQPKAQGNNGRLRPPERPPIMPESVQTTPESPTLGAADREIRHSRTPDQDVATLQALEGQGSSTDPGIPLGAIRRQSTFSSRGGDQDYGTDEEDGDLINPTLISFDVDTSDSPEPPAGVWSAELRPSHGGENRPPRSEPKYVVNALTRLPSTLAAANLGAFATIALCAPIEALMLRTLARAFGQQNGLSCDEMYNIRLHNSISWRGIANFLGIQIVGVLIGGEVWSVMTVISQWLHVTEEEWKEIHMEEEAERSERAERAARETSATGE